MRIAPRTLLAALCFTCLVFVAARYIPATNGSDGDRATYYRAANVGVVDIERVINDYLRVTGDMDKVRAKFATERRALDEIRALIESMRQEADVYAKDSEQYLNIVTQIAVKQAEYTERLKFNEAGMSREQGKLMLEAFRKAQDEIERYSKEKGLDLVHQIQPGDVKGIAYEAVSSQLVVRSVLYAAAGLDITEAISQRMR